MYPYLLFVYDKVVSGFCSPFELCQKQYSAELKEAAGYADGVSIDYNTTGRLTKIGGKEAMEWGNADSVYIADIPVISPCLKRYTHCVGIYMAKSMRVPVFLKLLLTDKGHANLTAILDNVQRSVVYTEKTMLNRQEVITASNNMMRTIKDKILPLRHGEPMP